jgi:hypothetical protein
MYLGESGCPRIALPLILYNTVFKPTSFAAIDKIYRWYFFFKSKPYLYNYVIIQLQYYEIKQAEKKNKDFGLY